MAHLLHLRVDKSPSQGSVVHRGVAGGERARGLRECPGSAAHGLHPAPNVHIGLAQHHGARSLGDSFQPRTAQSVDGDAGDLLRETGQEQGHSGDVAVVFAGLVRAPEVDILGLSWGHAAPLREGFEGCGAEVVRTDGAQSATVAAYGGADRAHDPGFVGPTVAHTSLLILILGFLAPLPESSLTTGASLGSPLEFAPPQDPTACSFMLAARLCCSFLSFPSLLSLS